MEVHLKQGLSIAFYNTVDRGRMGGADFSFPPNTAYLHLCLSGKAGDGTFHTECVNIHQNNDIFPVSGEAACIIGVGQDFVSDGCYVPKSGVVLSDDPSTSTLAPTSTSTGAVSRTKQSSLAASFTTLLGATVTTIITNGATETVVIANLPTNNGNSNGSNNTRNVVLLVIVSLLGVVIIILALFVWRKKGGARMESASLSTRQTSSEILLRH
ncbi:hypothetical protein GALMADRAFT_138697 [Galerina marginata CBS 339.88]|uniref:Uncharacterized protein n=1 Tax=Galerina marginata (strain CBS 339.88) TaxID=685588 RepID=A0A067T5J1_GALM3|nr:hypothetical protein GALMADRAFT_138697 [Galerina marginata CBS 339.88]